MKILAFPRDPNPYQELLYVPMRQQGHTVTYLEGPTASQSLNMFLLPFMLIIRRMQGYRVFHLHWIYLFALPWARAAGACIMQLLFSIVIWELKLLGFKTVWTAHNALPHRKQFVNDLAARKLLARHAAAIIVHSAAAKDELIALGLPGNKVTVIPHGNYESVYPNATTRKEARKQLGLRQDDFVIAFVGKIEGYKNLPGLLEAVESLAADNPHLHLVIAGNTTDKMLRKQLMAAKKRIPYQLHLQIGFVRDETMQVYFNAADVTATPFSSITTSGSALLSLSFGTPIIAPRIGSLKDMPLGVGFFYSPEHKNGLRQAIVRAMQAPSMETKRQAAKAYSATLPWESIAEQTSNTLEDCDVRHE